MLQTSVFSRREAGRLAPLILAYMGDAVYEIFVREHLIRTRPDDTTHNLHVLATKIVRASAQARSAAAVYADLTEEERDIYRRGRNAKAATVPKNADIAQYRMATGFEALIGYLYLCGDIRRLQYLVQMVCERSWAPAD